MSKGDDAVKRECKRVAIILNSRVGGQALLLWPLSSLVLFFLVVLSSVLPNIALVIYVGTMVMRRYRK